MHKINIEKLVLQITIIIMYPFVTLAEGFTYRYRADWLNSYLHKEISSSFLEDKWNDLYSDLRFDAKLSYNTFDVVLRPRIEGHYLNRDLQNTKVTHSYFYFPELFLNFELVPDLVLSSGRQSFQWGPAELVSWSNSLFHFNYNYRSFFHLENGKYLSRANYSFSKNTTLVLLIEHKNSHFKTDYEEFVYNEKYKNKFLGKLEYVFERAQDYLGLTVATGEGQSKHVGLYGAYGITELFSVYTDSRVSFQNSYYELTKRSNIDSWILRNENSKKIHPLMLVGARFEDSFDLRFEYIYNSLGMERNELNRARDAANPYRNINGPYNQLILSKNGREFLGKNYFYTSLRIPNLGKTEDLTLYLRHFISLQDSSFTLQLNAEKNLTEVLVCYLETDSAFGPTDSEMKVLSKFAGRVGFKYSF